MKTYNFLIIIILLLGVIIVTRELTIRTFQCMKCPIPIQNENTNIFSDEDIPIEIKYKNMFTNASPWIGTQQTEYIEKKEIDFSLMD